MKLSILASCFALTVSGFLANAEGQRVIVVLKSPEAFKSADRQFKRRGQFALKGFNLGLGVQNPLSNVNANVEDSLVNTSTLILNVNSEADIAKLQNNSEIETVEREIFHPLPRPMNNPLMGRAVSGQSQAQAIPGNQTPWGITAVKAVEAWKDSNAGENARVLVLDTGIDKDHPALAANFEQGKDFTGEGGTPYAFIDQVGHGTHVAGTVAGVINQTTGFTGVAPKAKILMGRVCSEKGCSNVSISQGINWGIQVKADLITMSLGGAMSTPAERNAIKKAIAAGITVVAASGNDGSAKVSYPAALTDVIAVGAVDSTLKKAEFSQYGPELAIVAPGVAVVSSVPQGTGRDAYVGMNFGSGEQQVASSTFQGARDPNGAESNQLVNAGLGKAEDFAGINVKGKYALISRGEIKFSEKVTNAIKAGATGVIVYNNAPGLLSGALTDDGSVLPVVVFMIEQATGQKIATALKSGQKVVATLKIVATDYSPFDGTSMATPHVAGVIALMKAANKDLTPKMVKEILRRTATPLDPNTANEYGSGMVNAELAVKEAIAAKTATPSNNSLN